MYDDAGMIAREAGVPVAFARGCSVAAAGSRGAEHPGEVKVLEAG